VIISTFIQKGEIMEKSTRIAAQVYGYSICLVAIITFLIATTGLITAIIDLGDPLHFGFPQQESPSLASYENYKLDVMRSSQRGAETSTINYVPTEENLKLMYEAARNDRIQLSKHIANKAILINSFLIAICIVLFSVHWIWMRRIVKSA
jgi:hypothetical protein